MKIRLTIFLVLFIPFLLTAQSVEIKPGVILPQMTQAKRLSIPSPTDGMLVFDTDSKSYWYFSNNDWLEINQPDNHWEQSGTDSFGFSTIKTKKLGGFYSEGAAYVHSDANDMTNPPTAPATGEGTRLMWIPSRSAFHIGTTYGSSTNYWDAENIGLFSFSVGSHNLVSGRKSMGLGHGVWATHKGAIAIGNTSRALAEHATVIGILNFATANYATAIGYNSIASGGTSVAIGRWASASNDLSIAIGHQVSSMGLKSLALGNSTQAKGSVSLAAGDSTISEGYVSTSMGSHTHAIGDYSTALGHETKAEGNTSMSMGFQTEASGGTSTAMGERTIASGEAATSFGSKTKANGDYSTAMGYETIANGYFTTSMGYKTTTNGFVSTAMGYFSKATGTGSTAIGNNSEALAENSTSIGSFVRLSPGGKGSLYLADASRNNLSEINVQSSPNTFYARFEGGMRFYTSATNDTTSYVYIEPGGNAWSSVSDSTVKENFIVANTEQVLNSIAKMKVGTWNYKGQNVSTQRHWGVMAQEFHKHFGQDPIGRIGNDKSISTSDFDGVSFAALKGLEKRTRKLDEENEMLRNEIKHVKSELQQIKVVLGNEIQNHLKNMVIEAVNDQGSI